MTPRDDGLSGQPKKRKMGKCRERPALQDMAEKVSANSMRHTSKASTVWPSGGGGGQRIVTDMVSIGRPVAACLRPFTYFMT